MYIQRMKIQTGKKFKRFRINNNIKFGKNKLDEFFSKKEIILEFTISYIPEQNGISERSETIFYRKTRTIIIDSGLPESF